MSTALTLEITARAGATRVAAVGEIDVATLGDLERTLVDLCAQRHPIELDLSGVSFVDSSGLATLLSMRNLCAEDGGIMVLCAPSQEVRRVLDLAGLSAAFTIIE